MFEHVPAVSEVDVLTSPDAVAAELAASLPRAEDMSALLMLDTETLSDAGRVDLLVAFERHIALLQAAQQHVLASLDGRALDWSGKKVVDYTREQVGAALRLSAGTAERRLSIARTLVERLPATLDLLRRGEVTYLHAMKFAEAVSPFDAETTAKIEQRVLRRAPEQTLSQFGTSLRRAVIAADPRRAEQRHDEAIAERRVVFTPQDDGITELWALLPADGAALIEAVLTSLGNAQTDGRTADQRRADALVDVFARVLGDPSLPEQHGRRPAINVTVSIGTLLGCDEQPADLESYGPITAAIARRLAADESGTWRRLVTDDTGQLLDYGRRTYRPPANLTDHVIASDQTCTFPGCQRTARLCNLDHVEAWTDGGETNRDNVAALCARHHNAKHYAGWRVNADQTEPESGPVQPDTGTSCIRLTARTPGGRGGAARDRVTERVSGALGRHGEAGEPGWVGEDVDLDDASAGDCDGYEGGRSAVRQGEHTDTARASPMESATSACCSGSPPSGGSRSGRAGARRGDPRGALFANAACPSRCGPRRRSTSRAGSRRR